MNSQHWIDTENGITQSKRILEAILPEYISIDERSTNDLINFIITVSSEFNYYNLTNEKEGDWSDFFINDFNIFLISLSSIDVKIFEKGYDDKIKIIASLRNTAQQSVAFDDLCLFVFTVSQQLRILSERKNKGDNKIINVLINKLATVVSDFKNYDIELASFVAKKTEFFGDGINTTTNIINALPTITSIFQKYINGYNAVLEITSYYLKEAAPGEGNDNPYIGLLKTFLHLYKHLQLQVNTITTKHLHYYYRNLLGIINLAPVPDKVHVFFTAIPTNQSLLISKGDVLTALPDAENKQLQYIVTDNAEITKAQIKCLYTLYISNYLQIASPDHELLPIYESQIYSKIQSVSSAPFIDTNNPLWPVLGEDQHALALNELTMDNAEIGFIIGSPLLYQQQGWCNFSIRFHLDNASFSYLTAYIKNYVILNNKKIEIGIRELFYNAFNIEFTGLEKWISLPKYAVKFNINDTEKKSIDFVFKINTSINPLHIYQQKIHTGNYTSEWPLVKILINNKASLNAFTYLRLLTLDRITVKVQVQGATNFTLQNNLGYLNASAPFMPFGPQPLAGSFIDIKNTNIFNRNTTYFNIDLMWMDLPVAPGGFKDYYAAYNTDINNSSFKVALSTPALNEPNKNPATLKQNFKLFNEIRDENGTIYLDAHTKLSTIDMTRLHMQNDMELEKENALFGATTSNGSVRLELSAPATGFGHKEYTQKFTEAILHNTKKGSKVPIPQLPYSPILKSITINYQLEHTEALHNSGKENTVKSEFVFHHIFPFGYKKEYPGTNEPTIYFLPNLTEAGNLMIGLIDIKPEQELSLLFELKQRIFDHSAAEPELIEWSYLFNNKWINIGKKNVYSDTTNSLINSGIIKIKIPKNIDSVHSILTPELFWLKVAVKDISKLKTGVAGVFANAVTAERIIKEVVNTEKQFKLKPNSLISVENKMQGIQNIWQPFSSFGGKTAETNNQYYARLSERLRHRDRPQTILDISQQILEAFPGILSIKCITKNIQPTEMYYQSEITLVVIPAYHQIDILSTDEPKVDLMTMYEIKKFITARISPFINVQVCNPIYEKIKIVCTIKFKEGRDTDKRILIKNTEANIKNYLCPWLYDAKVDIKPGAKIYLHEILNFLHTLPQVDYVSGFSILHFYNTEINGKLSAVIMDTAVTKATFIQPSVTGAIFLPSPAHIITTMENQAYFEQKKSGIGSLSIGKEFTMVNSRNADHNEKADKTINAEEEYFTFIIKPKQ